MNSLDKELMNRYDENYNLFKKELSFDEIKLNKSLQIFEIDEENNFAIPKMMDVVAILAGLPFDKQFIDEVEKIQNLINKTINNKICYMVKKENLGLELIVLKWPSEKRNHSLEKKVKCFLDLKEIKSIEITFDGLQIHRDGCIVLRGFDRNFKFQNLRKEIQANFPEIPRKQSNLVHVPLGRLLFNINESISLKLIELFNTIKQSKQIPPQTINEIKLIHEKQWYMVQKKTIGKWKLSNV